MRCLPKYQCFFGFLDAALHPQKIKYAVQEVAFHNRLKLKIARLRILWVQAAALTYLKVRPPQQGQPFPDPVHMQTGLGCRRQATFIVSNCCKECQDKKTKVKCCICLEKHGPKGNTV